MPAGVANIAEVSDKHQIAKPKVNTSLGAIPKVRQIVREEKRRESSAKEISTIPGKRKEQAMMSSDKKSAEKPSWCQESSQDVAGGSEQKMPPTLDLGAEKSSQEVTDGREQQRPPTLDFGEGESSQEVTGGSEQPMPPTQDFADEEMEQEMIEAVLRAEASMRREQLQELAEKKKQIEKEEQDLLKEVQKIETRERRIREAEKKSQEARRKAREEEDDWLLQALAFEQSRAEEQQEGTEDSPPPSGIQPPSLQVKTPPGEEPWLEQGGAGPVTILDVESRTQPIKKEQAAAILDKDKKGAKEQQEDALNVTENEWESSQKTEKEQQPVEPAPDRVLDASHGQVGQAPEGAWHTLCATLYGPV